MEKCLKAKKKNQQKQTEVVANKLQHLPNEVVAGAEAWPGARAGAGPGASLAQAIEQKEHSCI